MCTNLDSAVQPCKEFLVTIALHGSTPTHTSNVHATSLAKSD